MSSPHRFSHLAQPAIAGADWLGFDRLAVGDDEPLQEPTWALRDLRPMLSGTPERLRYIIGFAQLVAAAGGHGACLPPAPPVHHVVEL